METIETKEKKKDNTIKIDTEKPYQYKNFFVKSILPILSIISFGVFIQYITANPEKTNQNIKNKIAAKIKIKLFMCSLASKFSHNILKKLIKIK